MSTFAFVHAASMRRIAFPAKERFHQLDVTVRERFKFAEGQGSRSPRGKSDCREEIAGEKPMTNLG